MTPVRLKLEGALGIKAGLGLDAFDMNFSTIPEEAILVAIKGDNGAGKSTILNFMTPFLDPPWLVGGAYAQFCETGLRELIWKHADQTYRSRIEYRNNGKTKTQKAYLHVLGKNKEHVSQNEGDGWEWSPVCLPDNTVSDGKVSTYSRCIEHIIGLVDIYALSAFRAQNAPKLAEHDDPKALMRALLRLDEPAKLAEQAKLVVRELKRSLETVRREIADLDDVPAQIEAAEQEIHALAAEHPTRQAAKIDAMDHAAKARAELDRAMAGDLDRQRLIERRAEVIERRIKADAQGQGQIVEAQNHERDAVRRADVSRSTAQSERYRIEGDIERAHQRAESAQAVLSQRDAILAAEQQAADIAGSIEHNQGVVDSLSKKVDALQALAAQIRTLEAQQSAAAEAGKASAARSNDIQTRIAELNQRAGFVAQVPCRGEGEYASCPALQDALQARQRATEVATELPVIQGETDAKRAEWKRLAAEIAAIRDKTADYPNTAYARDEAAAVLAKLRARLDELRQVAARASALEVAERQLTEAEADAQKLHVRLAEAIESAAKQAVERNAECLAARNAVETARQAHASAVAELDTELDKIPAVDGSDAVDAAKRALAAAEAAVDTAAEAIQHAAAEKATKQSHVGALKARLAASAAERAEAGRLSAEIADWDLLAKGLRGVVDLSIEDAGPGIAALANQLLADAYGPRFSVRIVTQREQQNGVTVETFDISVLDAESGLESSVLQKSGGEAVWLDKALTDAVALYHQDVAGIHYETLFSDEAEDGLTAERKLQFYRMDRSALDMGGYRRKYFISHDPEAWAMADHVIDLAKHKEAA